VNKLLKRYLTEADCPIVTAHKLRHGFITKLIEQMVPIPTVSKIAGHSKPEITLNVYTKYRKCADNSKEIMEKLFYNVTNIQQKNTDQ